MAEKEKKAKAAAANERSLAAEAWDATKLEGDPEWDLITEVEFKQKLQFAADKAAETGIAQTNFEQEALRIHQKRLAEKKTEGPLAVSKPAPNLSFGAGEGAMAAAAAPGTNPALEADKGKKASSKSSKTSAKAKTGSKSKAKSKARVAPDKSGHVPTAKEAAAAAKEQANAPLHP